MSRRILILTPQLPYPPQQGTSLRNFHIVRGLAERNEVTVLSFLEPEQSVDPAFAGPLLALCDQVVTVPAPARTQQMRLRWLMTTRQPDMAQRLASEAFMRKLGRLLRAFQFDVVHVEGIELAPYMTAIRLLAPDVLLLYDAHNAETELQRRAARADRSQLRRLPIAGYSLVQVARLRRFEREACQGADLVTAVSDKDAEILARLSDRPVAVVPNCIDVAQYAPNRRVPLFEYDLVITGKMDYRPNVDAVLWFGREIWPLIRRSRPSATWAIVGQKPHERLAPLRSLPGVTVTGRVAQVQPYLLGGRVYIMPFRVGSGSRLKLVEAMAAGKAIVSTRSGAEGFPVRADEHLRLADEPQAFADAALALLRDHGERARLGRAAQRFARDYDWRQVIPRFERLYDSVAPPP
jgi:glycosyltransferase involved in cell wall biosynthesis